MDESVQSRTGRNTPQMRSEKGADDHMVNQQQIDSHHSSAKKVISGESIVEQQASNSKQRLLNKSATMSDYADQKFEEASMAIDVKDQKKEEVHEEQAAEDYESSPKESKIEEKQSEEVQQEEAADPDMQQNVEEEINGPTVTPMESTGETVKDEAVAVVELTPSPPKQVEISKTQADQNEPNQALESLKNQIEGIAAMLQGLNDLCEPSVTPKSTKREKRKRSTSNKKEDASPAEPAQTTTIEEANKESTVMPQRKIKSIKIKKVQRFRKRVTTRQTSKNPSDNMQEHKSLRKSQSATMRINRRTAGKKSQSEDSDQRRPWVAGIAPPSKSYERARKHQEAQRMFRSTRFSAQTVSDFAHLADHPQQWRSLSNSPVRLTDPNSGIKPYDPHQQAARAQQAYDYQARRLMLRSAQQSAPTASELHI